MPVRRLSSALRVSAASALVVACVGSHAAPMQWVAAEQVQPDVMRMTVRTDNDVSSANYLAPASESVQPIYAIAVGTVAASASSGVAVKTGIVHAHNHPLARLVFSALVGLAIVCSVIAYMLRGQPPQPPEAAEAPRKVGPPSPSAPRRSTSMATKATAPFSPPAPGRPAALLVSEKPSSDPVRYAIEKPNVRIGADDASDLVVRDDSVSRRHANIRFESGVLYLSDLGSREGTYLNGARVLSVAALRPADRIGIGRTEWRVLGAEEAAVVRGAKEAVERPVP